MLVRKKARWVLGKGLSFPSTPSTLRLMCEGQRKTLKLDFRNGKEHSAIKIEFFTAFENLSTFFLIWQHFSRLNTWECLGQGVVLFRWGVCFSSPCFSSLLLSYTWPSLFMYVTYVLAHRYLCLWTLGPCSFLVTYKHYETKGSYSGSLYLHTLPDTVFFHSSYGILFFMYLFAWKAELYVCTHT